MLGNRAWVLPNEVIAHFQRTRRAGLGIILEHFAPTGNSGIGVNLYKDPGILEDKGFQLGNFDFILRTNGSCFND